MKHDICCCLNSFFFSFSFLFYKSVDYCHTTRILKCHTRYLVLWLANKTTSVSEPAPSSDCQPLGLTSQHITLISSITIIINQTPAASYWHTTLGPIPDNALDTPHPRLSHISSFTYLHNTNRTLCTGLIMPQTLGKKKPHQTFFRLLLTWYFWMYRCVFMLYSEL